MRVLRAIAVLAALASAACNPLAPGQYDGQFRWTVDGQSFEASPNGRVALQVSNRLTMAGAHCAEGSILSIYFGGPLAPGTYDIASGGGATWTPDARTGVAAATNFEVRAGLGSGTVTLTAISGDEVRGHFSFTMVGDTGTRAVAGEFDLQLADRAVC